MKISTLTVQRTAKIAQLGELNHQTKNVWIVVHGYGQLVERFINKFDVLIDETTAVVMPEALQRFYLGGTGGKIGASWMTKEERESDINDNHFYLDQVLKSIKSEVLPDCKIHILGFSQGTATACRWMAHNKLKPTSLTLWAGMWPLDVDTVALNELLTETKVIMVLGNQDEYAQSEMLKKQQELVLQWGVKASTLLFEGKHTINQEALLKLKDKINLP